MDRLILLVGESGAGKSAVAKELEQLGYNILKSHTSREERYEGEWGHTFSNSKKLHDIPFPEIVAFQEVYNGLYYWATKDQYQGKDDTVYIICPDGAREVQEKLRNDSSVEVITIYLQVDEGIRWDRMSKSRPAKDVKFRLKADVDKFQIVKCDYTVDGNKELDVAVKNIIKILEEV